MGAMLKVIVIRYSFVIRSLLWLIVLRSGNTIKISALCKSCLRISARQKQHGPVCQRPSPKGEGRKNINIFFNDHLSRFFRQLRLDPFVACDAANIIVNILHDAMIPHCVQ